MLYVFSLTSQWKELLHVYSLATFDCWMTNIIIAITLSFTVPVFISLLFNIVGLVICIYVVVKLSCVSQTGQPKAQSDVLLQNFRVIVYCCSFRNNMGFIFSHHTDQDH